MSCVYASTVISNFGWSVDLGRTFLLKQNLSWCLHWYIVGWITVIVFLRVWVGLLSRSNIQWWILLLVGFLAWIALTTLLPPLWISISFHTHSALHTNLVWLCLGACVVLPMLNNVIAYLADYCTSTSLVPGWSALRSAAHSDIVVPTHRRFALAGPSSWNV